MKVYVIYHELLQRMKIARVFPGVTKATPNDEYTFYAEPGMYLKPGYVITSRGWP